MVITTNNKENPMANWLDHSTSNSDFCDALDEIMKREHEDVLFFDDPLSSGATSDLNFNLDSIPNLLETSSRTSGVSPLSESTTDHTQPCNIYDMASVPYATYPVNNHSQSNTTTPAYSSLSISPKFTALSIDQHHHPFSPSSKDSNNVSTFQSFAQSPIAINSKNTSHLSPCVQERQNCSILGTSYPLELQIDDTLSDVKRFRSSSMNEGATYQQQTKLDSHRFDPYLLKSPSYLNPSYHRQRTTSQTNMTTTTTTSSTSSLATDASSNTGWPYVDCCRPASNSFSEILNQQQQLRMNNNLSASYGGSPSFCSLQHQQNSAGFLSNLNLQPQQATNCTLYSLNQVANGAISSSSTFARTGPSLVGFPLEEIKDDPNSPSYTKEQPSEVDLWSDIEQTSSDHIQDDSIEHDEITTGDDDSRTVSTLFNADLESKKSTQSHSNAASLFWQYNVQAKGPKTKRILYLKERDPHLFREFTDPVYQIKLTQKKGQTLTKLRKGDGNDVTPNPMKLHQLGKQIRDLSSFVNKSHSNTPSVYREIYQVDQQANNNDTAEVKKEKNKIASRACRLRKKAQHEANKLKLHGLNEEHKILTDLITCMKLLILKRYHNGQLASPSSSPNQSLETAMNHLIANKYCRPVAGNTDGFVQEIINEMESLYATKERRSHSLDT